MKKLYIPMAAAFVAVLLVVVVVFAKQETITFTINNTSTEALGTVVVNLPNSQYQNISVSGYGQFTADIPVDALSISINGQTVATMVTGVVSLPNTHNVRASWESATIVIIDQNEF